jgi:hypothetical protein
MAGTHFFACARESVPPSAVANLPDTVILTLRTTLPLTARSVRKLLPSFATLLRGALLHQRNNRHAEAAECWRRYLANDAQSEWAARARRFVKILRDANPHFIAAHDEIRPRLLPVVIADRRQNP